MKNFLLWLLALLITLSAAYYQRKTGPTHPVDGTLKLGTTTVDYRLLRSHGGSDNQPITLRISDTTISGKVIWKRFKSYDQWMTMPLQLELTTEQTLYRRWEKMGAGDSTKGVWILAAELPGQPPAGKLEYYLHLQSTAGDRNLPDNGRPVITRFKGAVPKSVLIPHVTAMFLAMLFGVRAALGALFGKASKWISLCTLILIVIGGLWLGPVVQKYAFDAYWTGWPFGEDLTDNKTALAVFGWLVAWWFLRKRQDGWRRWLPVAAAVIMLGVYSIPHSARGSEIDYRKVEQQISK